jgi:hypothetical protein
LSVGDLDPVLRHRREHRSDVVRADLVPEAARAAVDHHADLITTEAERCRCAIVVHVLDELNLEEVVARPEASDLTESPRERAVAHVRRIGVAHRTPVFAQLEVAFHAVSSFDRVPGSAQQDLPQPVAVDPPDAAATQSAGDPMVELVHEGGHGGRQLVSVEG